MLSNKEFFNDKIDWKFFNFLLDKATEFEDKDLSFEIRIGMFLNNKLYTIYFYLSDNEPFFNNMKLGDAIEAYEKIGLSYTIYIYNGSLKDPINLELFYEKIKNKCYKDENGYNDQTSLTVKPK